MLRYVALPAINFQKEAASVAERSPKGRRYGKDDVMRLFDYLRIQKGVKRVIRVIIVDTETPSHSDEAIEHALKDLKVETWDWRKYDLCTESIFRAAPEVEELNLYWSGNNAVLRSWCEPDGLPKLKQLKKVYLQYSRVGSHSKSAVGA